MSDDEDRKNHPTTLGGAIDMALRGSARGDDPTSGSLRSGIGAMLFADKTEAEWAENDAQIAAAREAEYAAAAGERAKAKRSRLEKAGFPTRALDAAAIGNATPALVRVRDWKPSDENVLVLSGSPGCGKTVAAAWWAAQQSWAPAFLRATSFAASSRYDRESRAAWLASNALVLDDLGTEYADAKGSFLVDLDELLDVFYGNRKPLLITTNCTAAVFRDRYGARIVDRIRECGSFCSLKGASLRGKAGS